MDKITVDEIAAGVQLKKSLHRHTVLFLGARAGGLFRNPFLYHLIESYSSNSTSFRTLQEPEKFDKCYQALSLFNEREIYDEILVARLKEPVARPENDALAEIVREDVFDVIISTNIDPFVEDAFVRAGMREPYEYHVFIPGFHSPKDIRQPETQYCTLIKVFGDWKSRHYDTAGNEFVLEANRELKEFLEATLSENLLIVGYDPVWDAPIERAFPLLGGDCWYVNEEPPAENSHLAHMIRRRDGKSLIGAQGSYGNFITALHSKLMLSPSEDILEVTVPFLQAHQPAKELPPVPGEEKKRKVFISYSHKDARDLMRLRTHITSVERAGLIDVWDDTKIKPGTDWRQEIKIALEQARVAILLVSADFLASKFIAENELPPLLAAAVAGGTVVVPVILSPCLFDESPLSRFQAVNHPSKPLSGMKPYERDEIWVEVIRIITKEVHI